MVQAMDNTELDLVILNPARDKRPEETYTQFFLRKGVRGAILRSTVDGRPICQQIADEKFPIIVIGDHFEHPDLHFVYADSAGASRQAVEHLITLGHRRIAFAANEYEDADHADRFAGYAEALAASRIELDERLVYRVPARRPDGAQLLRNLMARFDHRRRCMLPIRLSR